MQNREDVDGSQKPVTTDAPPMDRPGHLGAGGDPAEGATPAEQQEQATDEAAGGPGVADRLSGGGDPAEGKRSVIADGSGAD